MALLNLVYRDQLFPREAYRLTFEHLREGLPDRAACKLTVELLSLAHDRTCEAQLASVLSQLLERRELPDMKTLRGLLSPDPASLPEVTVRPAPLSVYETLIQDGVGEAA